MMLRVDAVRAVGNYRAEYRAAEDLDLFLRLMERHDCANLPEFGLYYELNEARHQRDQTAHARCSSTLRLQLRYFRAPICPTGSASPRTSAHLVRLTARCAA